MNDKLNVVVVSTMPFPSGNASVNRILSYSKGLVELGNRVTVYTTGISNDSNYKFINGIRYRGLRTSEGNKYLDQIKLITALFKLMFLLVKGDKKYDALILVSNSLALIYPLYFTTKLKGICFIQEKSEFPFVLNARSYIGKIFAKYYVSTTYRLFDGLIIMTSRLDEYLKDLTKKSCKRIVIPMTVEPERFDIKTNKPTEDYIAYCGDISGNKDGVENLISAFKIVEGRFPIIKLYIIGDSKNPEDMLRLKEHAEKIGTKGARFLGRVSRDKIPPLLCGAKVLALARPNSLQSSGGFPTKLGEYLATGNPTVVTKVGDIPNYLTDNVHAFLAEPDNVDAFAEKICQVLSGYDNAKSVAMKGKELINTTFNYFFQAKRLEDYLIGFKQKR